jgi:hypothetical protein
VPPGRGKKEKEREKERKKKKERRKKERKKETVLSLNVGGVSTLGSPGQRRGRSILVAQGAIGD